MKKIQNLFIGIAVIVLALVSTPPAAYADTIFVVDNRGDGSDTNLSDGICNSGGGNCTLRAAIEQADALPGHDVIQFSIGSGVQAIRPLSGYLINYEVTIDATTQPGYAGTPLIFINGDRATSSDGIRSSADNVTIRGLAIGNFGGHSGIYVDGDNSVVEGNYLGVNPNGLTAEPNLIGMSVALIASNVRVGGLSGVTQGNPCHNPCNLISGNAWRGMDVFGPSATVQGNVIGLDETGSAALGNAHYGVYVFNGPIYFGGADPNAGNIVSGNGLSGAVFAAALGPGIPSDFSGSFVKGNWFGLDQSGTASIGNGGNGMSVGGVTGPFAIGGETPSERNVSSGNGEAGLLIIDAADVDVLNNFIGLDATGAAMLGNGTNGIHIYGGENINIGLPDSTTRNYIVGSGRSGIEIFRSDLAESHDIGVYRNVIGTNPDFTLDAGNAWSGIMVFRSNTVQIGSSEPDSGNLIFNSGYHGVMVREAHDTIIQGNYIGWHPTFGSMGNDDDGIYILNSSDNLVGGPRPAGSSGCAPTCNWVADNNGYGILVGETDGESVRNNIQGNTIFGNTNEGIILSPGDREDPMDADSGANLGQNAPVITNLLTDGTWLVIEGALHSAPDTVYTIEFYTNDDPTCPTASTSNPQGKDLLMTGITQTNLSGDISFRLQLAPSLWDAGRTAYVTAAVTDPEGNTSWFSNCAGLVASETLTAISMMLIDISDLIDGKLIDPKIAGSLSSRLESASLYIADKKDKAAVEELNTFIKDVDVFVQNKQLDPKYGQPLIKKAKKVIAMLEG